MDRPGPRAAAADAAIPIASARHKPEASGGSWQVQDVTHRSTGGARQLAAADRLPTDPDQDQGVGQPTQHFLLEGLPGLFHLDDLAERHHGEPLGRGREPQRAEPLSRAEPAGGVVGSRCTGRRVRPTPRSRARTPRSGRRRSGGDGHRSRSTPRAGAPSRECRRRRCGPPIAAARGRSAGRWTGARPPGSTSSSARNRSETSRSGAAWTPFAAATLARCCSRSSGTGQDVNRRRSVHRSVDGPQVGIGFLGPLAATELDAGEHGRSGSVRQPVDLGLPAQGAGRHLQVVQCGAAADHQLAAQRVCERQLAGAVGVQLEPGSGDAPAPGLGVVGAGARAASSTMRRSAG